MAEEAMARMLLDVAGDRVEDKRDLDLARAAARWATTQGHWQPHLHNGFFFERSGVCFWLLTIGSQHLELRMRLQAQAPWIQHFSRPVAHLGHALDVLASEGLIPARYSPLTRRVLEDLAAAHECSAQVLAELAGEDDCGVADAWRYQVQADTLRNAAESARRFATVPMVAV